MLSAAGKSGLSELVRITSVGFILRLCAEISDLVSVFKLSLTYIVD